MSRFSSIVESIQARYPTAGSTQWLVGARYLGLHQNFNRIICYTTSGPIVTPDRTASLADHAASADDTWLWSRKVEAVFSIWASTYAQAESRLHALCVAIVDVFGSADDNVGNMREQWHLEGVNGNGCQVDLLCSMTLRVLASDVNVVQDDADPGAGFPTTPATAINLTTELGATEVGPVTMPVD